MSGPGGRGGPGGSFPRRSAVTRRFTLGRPRSFALAADGSRVAFLRSPAGDDPVNGLWVFDVAERRERQVVDPRTFGSEGAELTAAERARRERTREQAGGIVTYAADRDLRRAAFVHGGALWLVDLIDGTAATLPAAEGAFDPRPDPTGTRVAYVSDRALRLTSPDGDDRVLAEEDDPNVSWGSAEFVAAEEMDRTRGFWWSPDGGAILAERVDIGPVQRWHVADPAEPARTPQELAYPAAGTPNAAVALALFDLDGGRMDVEWDTDAFPYLARVSWTEGHPPLLGVQSRDQRRLAVMTVDPVSGAASTVAEVTDDAWVTLVDGAPAWLPDGRLVTVADDPATDRRRIFADGAALTPPDLQVRDLAGVDEHGLLFTASADPTEVHVWRIDGGGTPDRLSSEAGVHGAVAGGGVVVLISAGLDEAGSRTRVLAGGAAVGEIRSFSEAPSVHPAPRLLLGGRTEIRTALLLPDPLPPGPLPVLLDPYGGPGFQRVIKARDAFLASQWLADQGFAVIVADGRGTPGRGLAWEKAVHLDLASPALEDQVEALHAVAEANPGVLDLDRVGIRGWSFGGYLAALAVLRRPDVFHAAVAGAPVTDWRLYDTHYTERFLGTPEEHPEAYARSSLLDDAARLERPLLIVHGLADDNVVAAHSLQLSRALLEAGRPHTFLPLSGVTHMTPQEVVAENLLLLQVSFLEDALGLREPSTEEA